MKSRLSATLRTSPVWLLAPALFVACAVAWAVGGYEPLVFDESLYETADEDAVTLASVDAEELEAASATATGGTVSGGDGDTGALADGTYVGYAACGTGNTDGWKPYYVAVTVEISGGAPTSIDGVRGTSTATDSDAVLSWDASENQSYLDLAISGRTGAATSQAGVVDQLEDDIASGVTPTSIDVVSGATYSSEAIFDAWWDALGQAGSTDAGAASGATSTRTTTIAAAISRAISRAASTASTAELADGTWTGYAACGTDNDDGWKAYYVAVTVKIADGVVTALTKVKGTSSAGSGMAKLSWDASENQAYLDWAISGRVRGGVTYAGVVTQLRAAISAGKSASGVDVVSGATYSSEAIFAAYWAALAESAAAVGSTVEVPSDADAAEDSGDADGTDGTDDATDATDDAAETDATDDTDTTDDTEESTWEEPTDLTDGTYLGAAFCQDEDSPSSWSPYYVIDKVTVSDGAVTELTSVYGDSTGVVDPSYAYDSSENGSYLNKALSSTLKKKSVKVQIQALIDAGTAGTVSTSTVDAMSSATWSSRAIVHAYQAAYDAALVAAGHDPLSDETTDVLPTGSTFEGRLYDGG